LSTNKSPYPHFKLSYRLTEYRQSSVRKQIPHCLTVNYIKSDHYHFYRNLLSFSPSLFYSIFGAYKKNIAMKNFDELHIHHKEITSDALFLKKEIEFL